MLWFDQILWILYFTSTDDAWFTALFNVGSSMHFSSRSSAATGFPGSSTPLGRRAGSSTAGGAGSAVNMVGASGAGVSYASYHGLGGPSGSQTPGSASGVHHLGPATASVQDLHDGPGASPNTQSDAASSIGTGAGNLKARALYSCEHVFCFFALLAAGARRESVAETDLAGFPGCAPF